MPEGYYVQKLMQETYTVKTGPWWNRKTEERYRNERWEDVWPNGSRKGEIRGLFPSTHITCDPPPPVATLEEAIKVIDDLFNYPKYYDAEGK